MSEPRNDKTKQERFREKKGLAVYFNLSRDSSKRLKAIRDMEEKFTYESFFSPWIRLVYALKQTDFYRPLTYNQLAKEFAKQYGRGAGSYPEQVEDLTTGLVNARDDQIAQFTDLYEDLNRAWPDVFELSKEDLKEYTDKMRFTEDRFPR